jgi:hypothetical protein
VAAGAGRAPAARAWEESHIPADERERNQAAEHALCFRLGPPSWLRQPATGNIDP